MADTSSNVVRIGGGGEVTKTRTPLSDLLEDSTLKRLQDHGYAVIHSADEPEPAKPAARKNARARQARPRAAARGRTKKAA